MLILQKIEKVRINDYNKKKKELYIKNMLVLVGSYIMLWYINREKEKGLVRFQFNKGVCMSVKNKNYNSLFQVRSVIGNLAIEQKFLNFSRFNILLLLKKNPIKDYLRNSLKYLRYKKNKESNLKVL